MEAKANSQEAKSQEAKATDGKAAGAASSDEDLSMEEILQSIRRIIAEDDKDVKKPADSKAAAKPKTKDDDVPGSDVFELTEMLKDDGSVVNVKTEMAKEAAGKDVLNQIDQALTADKKVPPAEIKIDVKPEVKTEVKVEPTPATVSQNDIDAMFAAPVAPAAPPPPPPPPVAPAAVAAAVEPSDTLLSQEAASASMSAFNKLKSVEQYVSPAPITHAPSFRDGTTVEDLVTEMLRPMMKAWLDTNLPQIVERIVEREIRKLTK